MSKGMLGIAKSDSHKEVLRQIQIAKLSEIRTCHVCGKIGNNSSAMNRWHFDNCRD